MNKDNMISVMKHFPGYGDNVDTHTGIAIDDRDYQNFIDSDFINQKKEIIEAVKKNEIPIEYIDTAVKRIIACKYAYGI